MTVHGENVIAQYKTKYYLDTRSNENMHKEYIEQLLQILS
jgi:hypothetical protein